MKLYLGVTRVTPYIYICSFEILTDLEMAATKWINFLLTSIQLFDVTWLQSTRYEILFFL